MKTLKTILLLLLATLGMASCGDDEPDTPPTPQDEFTLQLKVDEIQSTSAVITATPNDEQAPYFLKVVKADDLKDIPAAQVVTQMLEVDDFDACMHVGALTYTQEGLDANTQYIVVTFKYKDGKATAYATTSFVTASGASAEGERFSLSNLTADYESVKLHVTPSSLEQRWYYYVMLKSSYDEYLAKEGVNGPLVHTYYYWNNSAVDLSMNIGDYLSLLSIRGERDLEIDGLTQGTEYVFIVAYVDPSNTDPTQIYDSKYACIEFKTKEADGNNKPTIELLSSKVTSTDEGRIIEVTIRTSVAKSGKFKLSSQSYWPAKDFSDFMTNEDQAFTMANMMGRELSEDQMAALTSPQGCTFTYQLSDADFEEMNPFVFAIWVANEQGLRTAKAYPVGEE